ncbi:sugar-transfer associated ATP-grasp domain-containing protein [Maricaulis sp.]|uniref:sugar-transfer associated ATP-grasp domain-containing protein n=1 Tax=Maricaulis sp. TaxID=1486257 RepID=UPI00263192B8|nr:sugar-transfer associated ATP-grasp domain-containing protein [Maricaulis sp.]
MRFLTTAPLRALLNPVLILVLVCTGLLIVHFRQSPDTLSRLKAETLYHYSLVMRFDAQDAEVSVATYLPRSSERQEILREAVRSADMQFDDRSDQSGRFGRWTGQDVDEIRYEALIALQAVRFDLDEDLTIPARPDGMEMHLQATDGIQVGHPEIAELWAAIAPAQVNELLPVLRAIYSYTYEEISPAPFKGYTDALTALRLQQASCNGKGRLFAALARLNNIPARLVGGVVLNNGSKRTSHQWVEVLIEGRWVPFDPTNGHFGALPENYLRLYTGDEALFTHSSNINFDYRFSIREQQTSSALFRFEERSSALPTLNAAELMSLTGLNEKMIGVFLMFPIAALIIVFLRNVIGIQTFGTFMPMLVAAACVQTGLVVGTLVFGGVVGFAFLGQAWLGRYKLLKVPRLAAIITLVTLLFIVLLFNFGRETELEFGVLALFPIVIISFLAERIHNMVAEGSLRGMLVSSAGTVVAIACCYVAFSSVTLQGLIALLPELLVLVLALQIAAGRWTGMRLLEYFRFRNILDSGPVLSINERNVALVNSLNTPELLELAADKVQSKSVLREHGVPVADDLAVCRTHTQLGEVLHTAGLLDAFALKPNRGSQGNGILIVKEREGDAFMTPGGRRLSADDISHHICEILAGSFSQDGSEDVAFIEPLLRQHQSLDQIAALGLSDVRVILHEQKIISAMLRMPTQLSGGKANLHQGALGLAIDLASGQVAHASMKGKSVDIHPDTHCPLIGFQLPHWAETLMTARNASHAIPLGYIGVDICIDRTRGPLVLEVNGRPGIEIQNVQKRGLFAAPQQEELRYA